MTSGSAGSTCGFSTWAETAAADRARRRRAQFERTGSSERLVDAKAQLRHENRHQGGTRPFSFRFGTPTGEGKAASLVPDPKEQAAIRDMVRLREAGHPLVAIQRMMAQRSLPMSNQNVDNLVKRACQAEAAA